MANSSHARIIDSKQVAEQITQFNRQPFRELLVRWLGTEPTSQELQKFANKYPDRWSQYGSTIARLAGFSDRLEVDVDVRVTISNISDLELCQRIKELAVKLSDTIDITPVLSNQTDSKSST